MGNAEYMGIATTDNIPFLPNNTTITTRLSTG